jgi:malate dehydrogenase (oxaloacetate-decarboxylating)(NADP+)
MPLIFPLSNPTSKAEFTAQDAYKWTNGNCMFASGSPLGTVKHNEKNYVLRQGNNAYIFPGVALTVSATGATRVTDEMILNAAKSLVAYFAERNLTQGHTHPWKRYVT